MNPPPTPIARPLPIHGGMSRQGGRLVALTALLTALTAPLWAAQADRNLPLEVTSDGKEAAKVDLARKITTITGNVVATQGTLKLTAATVEVREDARGYYHALAQGGPATFRQKRDRVEEWVAGQAQRIEYDGASERVRLVGGAKLRLERPGHAGDEATAPVIVYDQKTDTVVFEGEGAAPAGGEPQRAKLIFQPRSRAAEPPASAASGP